MNFTMLQHSVFLQALGSAILNSLWQGFILWVIYDIIIVGYRSASSAFKNRLSTILIFSAFAWFMGTLVFGLLNGKELSPIITSMQTNQMITTAGGFDLRPFMALAAETIPFLSIAYIFLFFFLMIKLLSSLRYVFFIANNRLSLPTPEMQVFVSNVAHQINITRKISVWISHHSDVPATIGFLKPVILIPVASINNLSNDQLEAIILHELSHVRRNDYLINLLLSIVDTALFFNPFILLLSKVVKRERENCCDDFVMQYHYDPHTYASALLSLEQSRRSTNQLAIGAISGKEQLLNRIRRITSARDSQKQFNYGQKLFTLISLTAIICSIAWLSPDDGNRVVTQVATNEITPQNSSAGKENGLIKSQHFNFQYGADPTRENANSETVSLQSISKSDPKFPITHNESLPDNKAAFDNSENVNDSELPPSHDEETDKILSGEDALLSMIPLNARQELAKLHLEVDIDLDDISRELQNAYKSINAIDWVNIEKDINKSIQEIGKNNLQRKALTKLYLENGEHLSKLKESAEMFNVPLMRASLKRAFLFRDSIKTIQNDLPESISEKMKTRQSRISSPATPANARTAFSFNYSIEDKSTSSRQSLKRNRNLTFSIPIPLIQNHLKINFKESSDED